MIQLKEFQLEAINELLSNTEKGEKEIVLKSPTGSGKTVILTAFVDEFTKRNGNYVFVWLTPGKGNLEEQSKEKMDFYFPMSKTMLLSDVLTSGFSENTTSFINWELVTKKGNTAIADSERDNLQDKIEKAHLNNLKFILIIDEEHLNQTYKANDIIQYFKPECVIRASATPQVSTKVKVVEITDDRVIAEGLIKKLIAINESVVDGINIDDQISYLLSLALSKQKALRDKFIILKSKINPLIVVQMPNNSDDKLQAVENFLASQNITVDNKRLAIWLSGRHENLEYIEKNDAEPTVIIIKQAIATGWDCPRAHILVKLRDNMDETFEVQTIGRIRRMPEAKHYEDDMLDMCYLYTFDQKFSQGVKQHFGNGASEIKKLFLKKEFEGFKIIKEYNPLVKAPIDPKIVRESVSKFFQNEYALKPKDFEKNKKILTANGYDFSEHIIITAVQGSVAKSEDIKDLNTISGYVPLNTHTHGRDAHKAVGNIGLSVSLRYDDVVIVLRNLFTNLTSYKQPLFDLDNRHWYAFTINNMLKLAYDFQRAMSNKQVQGIIQTNVNRGDFIFPKEYLMPFNIIAKVTKEYTKNVYRGYLSSVMGRSQPEQIFERFCDENFIWWYKNGEHNIEYFSIVYKNAFGRQKHFYPDYIVMDKKQRLWILETKGGETTSGQNQDRDTFSELKFDALLEYGIREKINVGFVRHDEFSNTLLINRTRFTKSLQDKEWEILDEIIK